MLTEVGYWQNGSGQGERDYSLECLDYGIAFVGEQFREDIERIRVGDRKILRRGTAKIVAVGGATEHKGRSGRQVRGSQKKGETRRLTFRGRR
jgi:hypothetical protein